MSSFIGIGYKMIWRKYLKRLNGSDSDEVNSKTIGRKAVFFLIRCMLCTEALICTLLVQAR